GPQGQGALPAELTGYEFDARRRARLDTAAALKAGRTPLQVIEVAGQAAAAAERAVDAIKERYPPPPLDCREGCDWCCHLEVGAVAPEVLRVADYLRRALPPEELRAARERVGRLAAQRGQRRLGPRGAPLPCALLVGGRCAAYPVRPLTCRGCNST